jgi:hypothetical protein
MFRNHVQTLRRLVTAPTVVNAMPPIINHIDLSVGVPVKKREASDPNECEALTPNTIKAIPTAKSANPSTLFIFPFVAGHAGLVIVSNLFTATKARLHSSCQGIRKGRCPWLPMSFGVHLREKRRLLLHSARHFPRWSLQSTCADGSFNAKSDGIRTAQQGPCCRQLNSTRK